MAHLSMLSKQKITRKQIDWTYRTGRLSFSQEMIEMGVVYTQVGVASKFLCVSHARLQKTPLQEILNLPQHGDLGLSMSLITMLTSGEGCAW